MITEPAASDSDEVRALRDEVATLRSIVKAMETSRSWRLTAPLRRTAERLRAGTPARLLRRARRSMSSRGNLRAGPVPAAPSGVSTGTVCAIVHVYYPDLLGEIVDRLERCESLRLVLVTHPSHVAAEGIQRALLPLSARGVLVETTVLANRGRDVLPFVTILPRALNSGCDVFVKMHTKRSPHLGAEGDRWRTTLLDGLLTSPNDISDLVAFIASDPNFGFAVTLEHAGAREHWASNRANVKSLARRAGIRVPRQLVFPAGNMYWCSRGWLECLAALGLTADDFEPEEGQVDGTTAHAVERLIGCYTSTSRATIWLLQAS